MKTLKQCSIISVCLFSIVLLSGKTIADDTCVFAVTANDVPPNIVLLIDNGAEMRHASWHSDYENNATYPSGGSVFTNSNGYSVNKNGQTYTLCPINNDLTVSGIGCIDETGKTAGEPYWTIDGNQISLPHTRLTTAVDGIEDAANAQQYFRYSTNYLNWLFYYNAAVDLDGDGDIEPIYDSAALSSKSRFYYAKQAIFTVAKLTANRAKFAIYSFTSNSLGAASDQPLGLVVNTPLVDPSSSNTLDSNFVNNVNNMGTVTYSPLAEGLASVGGYYASPSSHVVGEYCQKSFVVVISPGISSKDLATAAGSSPTSLDDYDSDSNDVTKELTIDATTFTVPTNFEGSTYLDDVAYYLHNNDIVPYKNGTQTVETYTIGFMGNDESNKFLINTSNNGNGNENLYDSNDPEYGKYHFEAEDPDELSTALLNAINSILERTNAFAAPVVPITRTTSGDKLYMSFFTPSGSSNFWEGNVVKFGLNSNNDIVDKNGALATYPNGALKEDIEPYWETVNWADTTAANGVLYSARNIYTYLGASTSLTNASNAFSTTNGSLTSSVLGTPTHTTAEIIEYIRGKDVFDEDTDTITAENRALITGDVLHSEPLVFQFIPSAGTLTLNSISGSFQNNEVIRSSGGGSATANGTLSGVQLHYDALLNPFVEGEQLTGLTSGATATISAISDVTMIFYGANDGMLHAVRDTDGTEAWGFIPPDQLSDLKDIVEGTGHQYFVDSSPKIYLYESLHADDADYRNGFIDTSLPSGAADDKVILVSGERKGSNGYFALDVTAPESPKLLWRINQTNDLAFAPPDHVITELGESWSEPEFGLVKTTDLATDTGTAVMFIGGGYKEDNSKGNAILAIDVLTGAAVKTFKNGADNITTMDYSIPSNVKLVDADNDDFVDKLYVGDMGGQIWRLTSLTDPVTGTALTFPDTDENINNWKGWAIFNAGCNESDCTNGADDNANSIIDEKRKFFYTPSVTLENDYDLVFAGSGDRENPCETAGDDKAYAIKDTHATAGLPVLLSDATMIDITLGASVDLDGSDSGWYLDLVQGEKVLAEGTVFAGVYYFTTFTPNDDACVPGGIATLYGLDRKTGDAVVDFDEDGTPERGIVVGGGIPSRPVVVISDSGEVTMFVSVGTTNPDDSSPSIAAGIKNEDPFSKTFNFYYLWWKGLFD